MRKIILMLSLLLLSSAGNASMMKFNDQELTLAAKNIVRGKVVKKESFWDKERSIIFTRVTLKTNEVLKGAGSEEEVEFVVPGGTVGSLKLWIEDAPELDEGEEALFFIHKNKYGQNVLVGLKQGKLGLKSNNYNTLDADSNKTMLRIKKIIKDQQQ
ncbi:MAG: hypothetical protein ABII27_08400 [bacterium]